MNHTFVTITKVLVAALVMAGIMFIPAVLLVEAVFERYSSDGASLTSLSYYLLFGILFLISIPLTNRYLEK